MKYGDDPGADEVGAFERVIHRARLSNGIYRTTYSGRMAEVDAVVGELLRSRAPRGTPLGVHDWAASDCLAASEWAKRLFADFPSCRVTASDLSFFLLEAGTGGAESFILEEGGAPLQYVRRPFVIDLNAQSSPFYPVNRWLLRRARRRVAGAVAAAARARWRDIADRRPVELPPWRVERIPLIHPEAIRLLNSGGAFHIERHSVFDALPRPVAVIRTMNILNRIYFPEERLRAGIRAVFESLEENGIWIVGRTLEEVSPPENHASVWEKSGVGFTELVRLRSGSEIADLVREFRAG